MLVIGEILQKTKQRPTAGASEDSVVVGRQCRYLHSLELVGV